MMEETPVLVDPALEKAVLATETDETLRKLPAVLIGGTISAVVGAGLWGVITYITHFQHAFMAIGIGLLVSMVLLKIVGTGSKRLGVIAALFAFGGTLLGNILVSAVVTADAFNQSLLPFLAAEGDRFFPIALAHAFSIAEIIFYGLTMYIAFYMAQQP